MSTWRPEVGFVQDALQGADATSFPRLLASMVAVLDGGDGRQRDLAMAIEGAYLAGIASTHGGTGAVGAPTVFGIHDLPSDPPDCAGTFAAIARFWKATSPDDGRHRLALAPETSDGVITYALVEPMPLTRVRWTARQVDALVALGLLARDGEGMVTMTVRGRFLALRGWSSSAFPAADDATWARVGKRGDGARPVGATTTVKTDAMGGRA